MSNRQLQRHSVVQGGLTDTLDPLCVVASLSLDNRLYKCFIYIFQPPVYHGEADCEPPGIKAVVEEAGFITLHLEHGMAVFVAPNQAVLVIFIDAPTFKIPVLKRWFSFQGPYSGDVKTRPWYRASE